ncbi:hypothetical protein LP419_10430 [Massilia sp. H-1]|nr:hypothetical protein LP419_10430 [Massilia sp. H-1]
MTFAFKLVPVAIALAACLLKAQAWNTETHRRIVLDAVQFMKTHPAQTRYAQLLTRGDPRCYYTMDQFAAAIGQGAHDVDYFEDTYICGATTGNCQGAPVWGLASGLARYTSFWHFQNHTIRSGRARQRLRRLPLRQTERPGRHRQAGRDLAGQ